MKKFIYSLMIFGFMAAAHSASFESYPTQAQRPNISGVAINWAKPTNKKAASYRSAFDHELALVKAGEKHLLGQRYVMINPGCGSECQVVGYFDIYTGEARLADITSSYGIQYRANSSLLVVNPRSEIEATYGSDGQPGWLKTEFYQIQPSGQLKQIEP